MLDHREAVPESRLPACRMHENPIESVGDGEFGFRGAVGSSCYENFRDEFCFQAKAEKGIGAYTPPLWKIKSESSPLLPCDHQYSNLSPRTRLQMITEARKELMEMLKSMPESSYELSLKDIVDEQQQQQQTKEEINKEESTVVLLEDRTSFRFETEDRIQNHKKKKRKNKSNIKERGQISRSTSMESGTFLIKIFFPRCFSSKRRSSTKNRSSKVSPRTSFEISEKDNDSKEQWIAKILVTEESIGNGKNYSSSSGSSSGSNSCNTSRVVSNYFSLGCWPFFQTKKSKARRQTGCIF